MELWEIQLITLKFFVSKYQQELKNKQLNMNIETQVMGHVLLWDEGETLCNYPPNVTWPFKAKNFKEGYVWPCVKSNYLTL